MIKLYILFLFLILNTQGLSQDYHIKQYRVNDGLPSDIVKGCAQDSLGYFWIATDDGLVKYDGITFTTFHSPFHNSYIKGFFTAKDGRFFVFGDLDFMEIRNDGDSAKFKPILLGTRLPSAHTLTYPKAIYEDHNGDIWISESQSVVRIHENYFKRYEFDLANRSPQFLRSFSFFEDQKNNLFVASFQGNIFFFDPSTDQFEFRKEKLPTGIEHLSVDGDQLLIGSSEGFYTASLLAAGSFANVNLRLKQEFVSFITPLAEGRYFVATRGVTQFLFDSKKKSQNAIPFKINNVNHVYVSRDKDIWVSSNEGLFLLKEKIFHRASEIQSDFIEAITEIPLSASKFYATKNTLYSFDSDKKTNKEILTIPEGYFQSLAFSKKGIWAANAFQVFLFKDGRIMKKFDFSDHVRFITDLFNDSKNNLWISQPGNPSVYQVDSAMKIHGYKIPFEKENVVNVVREGHDGMYIASAEKNSYLFFKGSKDSAFVNISLPVPFAPLGDFNISEIAFLKGTLWLASTEGLLRFDKRTLERQELGLFTEMSVKTVRIYQGDKLLFTNSFGLILFDPVSGDYDLFNESNGLISNTIKTHGLFVAQDGAVWVGTSKGLCYTNESLTSLSKTPPPRIVNFLANGKRISTTTNPKIAHGSFVSLVASSITFPENEVKVQYRMNAQSEWINSKGAGIDFSDLSSGQYTIEIRSRKNGPFSWSDSTFIQFKIDQPFWERNSFILSCILVAAVLISGSMFWANVINKRRRKNLELLIAERTNALRLSNEELSIRNNELDRFVYSASHDLSAPLKSIQGLINVAKMEKPPPQIEQYLDLMKRSVLKLDSFIQDIIMYSRNTRLPIKHDPIALNAILESIWADHLFAPHVKQINFEIINTIKSELRSDEMRLKIIFNNLISNAIKFHVVDLRESPYIKVTINEFPGYYEFTVADNGMGIAPNLKEKIFDMFFRATDTVSGSGLGLYILKETIATLNGSVDVESELDKGTVFTIRLPKQE